MSERRWGRVLRGVVALVALVAVLVGVPWFLVRFVGNPWPGSEAVRLVDTEAIVLGVVATLAWLVWARFTVAVVAEVPGQWRQRAEDGEGAPPLVTPPARNTAGLGLLAARLVAAVLVLMPVAAKVAPFTTTALPLLRTPVAMVSAGGGAGSRVQVREPVAPRVAPAPATIVAVRDGDTLRGIARDHLGDAERWREIFDLNRDRPQVGGARLSTPSAVRPGWSLLLPAGSSGSTGDPVPAPAGTGPTTVTVVPGDTLWDLTRQRLEEAGRPADDHHVIVELSDVIAANPAVVDDPDLILPGQVITLPPLDLPPPVPAGTNVEPASPATALPAPTLPPPTPAPPDEAPAATTVVATTTPTPATTAPADVDATTATTTDSTAPPVAAPGPDAAGDITVDPPSPSSSPVGLGEATLLSSGLLALLIARRRRRLRAAEPRARIPEPPPEHVAVERRLRHVDARERLVRIDVALRAAAASLLDGGARPAIACIGADGHIELTLTGDAALPAPWVAADGRWRLPGTVELDELAPAARRVGAPCVALTQLGVDETERDVLVDLEALGVLSVHGPEPVVDGVIRGIAATLASSIFADTANLVGVGLDELVFLDHRLGHHVDRVDEAVELATTLVGTTASARQSTFVLRARHTSGEAWEPAVVVVGTALAHEVTPELVRSLSCRSGGVAMVVGGESAPGPWSLVEDGSVWRLEPLGLRLTPVGLSVEDLTAVYEVLHEATTPLPIAPSEADVAVETDDPPELRSPDPSDHDGGPPWHLLVRLLGDVDVVDREGRAVRFERSKTMELLAWLAMHREHPTRTGARSALWELDVRDATFANVVSEARRALARHVPPPAGEEWLARTLTERLPLHELVVTDAAVVEARLAQARREPAEQAIATLRPAVELVRGLPFSGTGYLWPDPEGITSHLVLLATAAAGELARHHLALDDVDGVFWATGRGLSVLPGHEELIALRMRAHHRRGDLAGVRAEWESYERVLDADEWGDGEPAPKLVELRRELLTRTNA